MSESHKPSWVEKFRIDESTWQTLSSQAARSRMCPIAVAIETSLINESKLVEVEQTHSSLPALRNSFFANKPESQIFRGFDFFTCKSKGYIPLGKWDGMTYLAKLTSDPIEIENQGPHNFWVLSTWSGMKKWMDAWEQMGQEAPTLGINLGAQKTEPSIQTMDILKPEIEGVTLPPEQTHSGALETTKSGILEAPQGLLLGDEFSISKINFDIQLPNVPHTTLKSPAAAAAAPPPRVEMETAPKPVVSIPTPQIDLSGILGAPLSPTLQPPAPAKSAPPVSAAPVVFEFDAPVGMTLDPQPVSSAPVGVTAAPQPISPAPVGIMATPQPVSPAPTGEVVPLEMLEMKLSQCKDLESLATTILGGWSGFFDKSMILLLQGGQLQIWKASGQWTGNPQPGTIIALDTPSIFKIVLDTKYPYHGHVTPGPVNDFFFANTNSGVFPDHVTVVPMVHDRRVLGMIFGGCKKESGRNVPLQRIENFTRSFAGYLVGLSSKQSKSA